jgi:hypothetical protein
MNNLEKIYKDYFKETFDKLGLEIYENSTGRIKFKSTELRLQLLDDRGLIETDISPLHGQENFRSIEEYNSLLTVRKSKTKLTGTEKRQILGTRLDYNSQTKFLIDSTDALQILLNKDNYKTTLKDIEDIGQERNNYY